MSDGSGVLESGWPRVSYEGRSWAPCTPVALSASVLRRQAGPYEAAVPPRIASVEDVPLTTETRTLVTEASTEIARFDTEVGADIAPFASILLRSESVASSRIENLTASAIAIALPELGDTSRDNAAIIVANTAAMRAAIDLADELDTGAILAMHDALLGATQCAGRWRDVQNWIGGSDYSPHDALFVPPHPDLVPDAMADLVTFMARNDLPPLVQAAVAHAQFETIHPFPDGNGRCGRALVHSLLRGKGLTRKVTVPVSALLSWPTSGSSRIQIHLSGGGATPGVGHRGAVRQLWRAQKGIENGQHRQAGRRAVAGALSRH